MGMDLQSDLRSHSIRSEEHTSELQSRLHLVCRLLLEKKKPSHAHEQLIRGNAHNVLNSRSSYALTHRLQRNMPTRGRVRGIRPANTAHQLSTPCRDAH